MVLLCALYGFVIHFKSPEQVLWAERYTDAYEGRLRSTYICPNHFAHLLQMLLPFLAIWVCIAQVSILLRDWRHMRLLRFYRLFFNRI